VKSNTGLLSEARLNAPAGICIVLEPSVTGELLKWKVIVLLALLNVGARFDGIPLTVKALAWTVDVSTASLRLMTKSIDCVLMALLHAGVVVVTPKPTSSLSVKASCWEEPLMATRPSVHDVTCLAIVAEP
jgi:hypothetical protein